MEVYYHVVFFIEYLNTRFLFFNFYHFFRLRLDTFANSVQNMQFSLKFNKYFDLIFELTSGAAAVWGLSCGQPTSSDLSGQSGVASHTCHAGTQ